MAKNIGNAIKKNRVGKKMTQEDLANAVGTTKAAISRYELNQREPRLGQLHAIADALKIPVANLLEPPDCVEICRIVDGKCVPVKASELECDDLESMSEKILDVYGKLNEQGKQEAIKRISEMSELPQYQK